MQEVRSDGGRDFFLSFVMFPVLLEKEEDGFRVTVKRSKSCSFLPNTERFGNNSEGQKLSWCSVVLNSQGNIEKQKYN